MNRKSRVFRASSGVLAAVVAHFLCGGPQWAQAASESQAAAQRRSALAASLKVPVELLEDPAAFQRAQDAKTAQRMAAALEKLRAHTASSKQAVQVLRSANFAKSIDAKSQAARLSVAAAKAQALGLSTDASAQSLELVAPGFRKAALRAPKKVKIPKLVGQPKKTTKPPAEPRTTWPKQGALTPSLEELYASVAGTDARVVMPDGSELPAREMSVTPVARETRLAGLLSDLGLGLPLLGTLPPPAAEDTAQTPETVRTAGINALLQQTGPSALAIYNAVAMRIRPELYFGSKKGADATLREGAGNDFDTAALLVGLLRGAGIPARYEYGTVSLSRAQVESLTGAKTTSAAAQLLSAVGIPNSISADGSHVLVERVWVRAWVPLTTERYGGTAAAESLWVRLDAGLKLQEWAPVANLKGVATFSQADYLATPTAKSPQAVYETQLLTAARAANRCNTLDEALYLGTLKQPAFTLLPAEHPAEVVASLLTFARPPEAMRWTVSVEGPGLSKSFDLSELEYHTLAVRYVGATPADEATLSAAGDITNVVPYQVQVKPVLRLDGVEVARGSASMVGVGQLLTVRTTAPQGSARAFTHRVVAGGVYGLSLSGGVTTDAWATEKRQAMTGLPTGSAAAAEAAAHAVQAFYSNHSQTSARRLAALTGHVVALDAFESLAGRQLLVTEVNGLPVAVRWGLYFISANDSMTPIPRDGNSSQVANLSQLWGLNGSFLESQSWEEVFSRKALSSVSIIHAAKTQAVPVDTFTSGTVGVLTGYSQAAIDEMNEALSAGWTVTAPRHPVSFCGYLAAEGYTLVNPLDGTGGYKVSFDLNGGGSDGPAAPSDSSCPACDAPQRSGQSVVDVAAAAWRETWSDLTLPGAGMPIAFGRTYASRSDEGSTLGPRWMHSYATALRLEGNGDVTWIQDDLRTARFTLAAPNTWTPPPGYFQRLTSRAGGYRLTEKDGTARDFDGAGRLLSLSDTSGNSVTCIYSGGLLSEVRDATGQLALSFTYTAGQLTQVTDRASRSVSFSYTDGNLTGFTDALGHTEAYGYDDAHRLTSFTDVRGKTRYNFYDSQGRWAGARDALGFESRLLHDAIGRRAVFVDKLGARTVYEWGAAGELLATIDPVGNEKRLVRDANFLPREVTDGRGFTTAMQYDARGNMLSVAHPDGRSETFSYDSVFNKVLTQTATGLPTVTNTYDASGRLETRTDGIGQTRYDYDARGQLRTVTAPGNAVQTFTFDTNGNLRTVTDATQRTMTLGYDAAGHVTSTTDNANLSRTMEVDALGRISSMTDELHRTTTFVRDEAGHTLTSTDALNHPTVFTYDALGRLRTTTDATGATRSTEYDAEGRVIGTVDALKKRSTREYDAAGRLISSTDAAGFTTTLGYCADVGQACADIDALGHVRLRDFDAVGRLKTETDDEGRVTTSVYDSGGRVKHSEGPMQVPTDFTYGSNGLLSSTSTALLRVTYGYDERGNRTEVRAFNSTGPQLTTYTFDKANRLLSETNPLNQATVFTYDARGNRETKLDAKGHLTRYTYDDARRLTDVSFFDGTAYAFRFDELGRRVSESNSNHSRGFTYDALGRVKTSTDALTGAVVTSEYDAEGRRTRMTEGGVDRRFEYDARGLLRRLQLGTSGWLDVTHDALGRRTSVTRPNGVRSDWVYDDVGQLTSVLHSKAGVVLDGFSYTYDSHGRRDSKTRTDGTSEAYTYDAVDRLTRVDEGTGRSSVYVLDAVSNRSSLTVTQPGVPAVVTTSSSNAFNQLRTSSRNGVDTAYVYDANGNLTSEAEGTAVPTTYTWDADNRLRQVAQPTLLSTYEYDANGLRVKKVEGGVETRFLLDGASVVAEYDSSNAATRRYLQNPESIDDILEFTEGGQAYFPLVDALGSVIAITNSGGTVVTRNSYEVYGSRTTSGAGPQWAFGFTGREQDASNWRYHRDRYASALNGSWGQPDRAGFVDGPNAFSYGQGQPTYRRDPDGRSIAAGRVVGGYTAEVLMDSGSQYFEHALEEEDDSWLSSDLFSYGAQLFLTGLSIAAILGVTYECKRLPAGSGPTASGGALVENIPQGVRDTLQRLATKYDTEITVVGSRASGRVHALSDWDYLIAANRKTRNRLLLELPRGARDPSVYGSTGIDILNSALNENLPHIIFRP